MPSVVLTIAAFASMDHEGIEELAMFLENAKYVK